MTFSPNRVLVTGASRGIGQAIAVAFASGGAHVFCVSTASGGCDATLERIAAGGGSGAALVADVSDEDSVAALAETVLAEGGLDVLVNNAGVARDGVFLRMSSADFDRVIGVNLRGTFLTCRAFARAMARAKTGRIVNVSSVIGLVGNAGQTNYAASKAGVIGFSKALARELAGRGVTVNVVAPGFVATDMTRDLPEDYKEASLKNIPLGRFGTAQDVAGAVSFLCSEAASYITGQVLVVDGGMTM